MLGRWLDRLDALPALRFTLVLYLLRWIALAPVMWLGSLREDAQSTAEVVAMLGQQGYFELAWQLLLYAPLFETLVECLGPYFALRIALRRTAYAGWRRPWPFVALSALIMVLLHPLDPQVIAATAITGSFLAYTYGHFAPASHWHAFAWTSAFHAGINAVGFALIEWQRARG